MLSNKENIPETQLIQQVADILDWGQILDVLPNEQDSMRVRFFMVEYEDWLKLYPSTITDLREFEFFEKRESGKGVILVQDLIKTPNFDIKNFLRHECYIWVDKDGQRKWFPL